MSNVQWVMENGNYRGLFTHSPERRTSVTYDKNGNLMETHMDILESDLPTAAMDSFKGKKASRIVRVVDAKGNTMYDVTVDNKRTMFDAQGKPKQ